MKKAFKIFLKTIAGFISLLLILFAATAIYFSTHKKKLAQLVVAQLQKKVNADIRIEEADVSIFSSFPQINITLSNVFISDSLYYQHHHPFLKAGELKAKINFYDFIKKKNTLRQIELSNAVIDLFTDSTGYSNKSIFKLTQNNAPDARSKKESRLQSITLKAVQLIVDDRKKEKYHAIDIKQLELKPHVLPGETQLQANATLQVGQLSFNAAKGSYLKNTTVTGKFLLRLQKSRLLFDSVLLQLNKQPFIITGNFDLGGKADAHFFLRLNTSNANYDQIKTFLPHTLAQKLSMVQLSNSLNACASVAGLLSGGEPLVNVEWNTKNNNVSTSAINVDSASFNGSYTNEIIKNKKRNDSNSGIFVHNFKGLWNGVPVQLQNFEISNLKEPFLRADLSASFPLSSLSKISAVHFQSGTGKVALQYHGLLKTNPGKLPPISGLAIISNATLVQDQSNAVFSNINAHINITPAALLVQKLDFRTSKSMVKIQGEVLPITTAVLRPGSNGSQNRQVLTGITLKKASVVITASNALSTRIQKVAGSTQVNNGEDYFKTIFLQQVSCSIEDKKMNKLHQLHVKDAQINLQHAGKATVLHTRANVFVKQLGFNTNKGVYLKNTVVEGDFALRLLNKHLLFNDIPVRIDHIPFRLSGNFDLGNNKPQFSLTASAPSIDYTKIKNLLTEKLATSLGIVSLDKPLAASVYINGPLKGGEPYIKANWVINSGSFKTPFFDFDNTNFSGSYTNEAIKGAGRNDSNSVITADNFSATWHDVPVSIHHLEISNLSKPALNTDLSATIPLAHLNELLKSKSLDLQSGRANVVLKYKGPLERNENTNSLIDASIQIDSGKILYIPRNVLMADVNGKLAFKKTDLFVENLQCNVLNTFVQMNGTGRQLLSLINTKPNNAVIDWNIYSPTIDLNNFLFLLKKRDVGLATTDSSNKTLEQVAGKIDSLLDQGILKVAFKSDTIRYENFNATNLHTNITLLQDKYIVESASMNHAGGNIEAAGSMQQQPDGNNAVAVNASFSKVDVARVLAAFDNFGQNGIVAENIDGTLSAKIKASMHIADTGRILPETIESDVYFSLKNGALKKFGPIKKIQKFVLKNRDFDAINFAELKDSLRVRGRVITIHRMEIQSSVLSMFVEGIYSMYGKTDISIQLPLSNLKKRRRGYIPKNIGINGKTGPSIYLRGRRGKDGNIKFRLDLFKRYFKNKGKEYRNAV